MKVALVILFSALTIASANQVAVDAPPASPTGKIPPQVHARNKRAAACGPPTKLNADQCTESINAHNIFRAREPSTNIRQVVWDDEMASQAQAWSDQCLWKHGMLTDCAGNAIGQNLFVEANPSAYPKMNLTGVVEAWWNERSDFNWDTRICAPNKLCGHWTQLVAAQSYRVGCAYTLCPSIMVGGVEWKNALYVACDYSPAGNVMGAGGVIEPVYEKGTACSNCGYDGNGGGYKCVNNLCAKCNPATDAACKCGTPLACANGSWDAGTCSCKCNKGFYGLKCETSCACTDSYDQCDALKAQGYCTQPDYAEYMTGSCRGTCTTLCKPPASCSA